MPSKLRRYGMAAATFEINDDSVYQDMLNPLGFSFALSLCLRLYKQVPRKLVATSNLFYHYVLSDIFECFPTIHANQLMLPLLSL